MKYLPLVLAALVLVSCGTRPDRFRVATDPHHPPLSFLDDHDQPVGYEIDLVQALAAQRGWSVEIVTVPTQGFVRDTRDGGILGGLDRGDYDAVASSVVASNRLRERWSLSVPYLDAGPVTVIKVGSPAVTWDGSWTGTLGMLAWGAGQTAVRRTEVPDWRRREYRDTASLLADLDDGIVTAAVADRPDVAAVLYEGEKYRLDLRVTPGPRADEQPYSLVLRRDDPRLPAVDEGLNQLEQAGILGQLRAKWHLQ